MRAIDADSVYDWYVDAFGEKNLKEMAVNPNECRFSMNDINGNLTNIPTITIAEQVQEIVEEMCKDYCKWPDLYDEEMEDCELSESSICKNCPLNRLV